MPELPEVETVVRGLRPDVVGRTVTGAWTDWPRVLDGTPLAEVTAALKGRTVAGLVRRGKYIGMDCDGCYLVIHLRMTGRLYMSERPEGDDRWVHFSLALDDGRHMAFSDSRKFGRVTLCSSLDFLEEKLGPEPLTLSDADFANIIQGSSRAVKTFILDQSKIAGVGNIYADESLLRAGIHPLTPVNKLSKARTRKLGAEIRRVLQDGIDHEGASISWYRKPDGNKGESQQHFLVYGRTDLPCKLCGTAVQRTVVGQRGTHFCPKCQRL
ncbi:DNA-formamidopyrimidine glycosylase [Acanthopleuribacter pedis]|uniref:Formamidopyrimidine-DNA glycosylase n=1 Tax=Acanthopleuribacter pedis TaxID=442870 RepID=A0A8J7QKL1_9BACT|nr:DNA-formamidopyrimidine glycosylase [Acanthopleuribacter pedis]MBO1319765.1 DNA-formamidopyrimidine glycosylase [Acanthopleuribacter pedis]